LWASLAVVTTRVRGGEPLEQQVRQQERREAVEREGLLDPVGRHLARGEHGAGATAAACSVRFQLALAGALGADRLRRGSIRAGTTLADVKRDDEHRHHRCALEPRRG
jgi:hypothetical protein